MGGKPRAQEQIVLLVRKIAITDHARPPGPYWAEFSTHKTAAEAEDNHRRRIAGRGITAWSWWGPRSEADKMLADPNYEPKED